MTAGAAPAGAGGQGDGATAAARGGGAEDGMYTELWNHCAGPLVTVPSVGDKVYYFPQGHIEQIEASTNQVAEKHMLQLFSLPWKIPCEVVNIELMVEPDTDEVYAQLSLLPETKRLEDGGSSEEIPCAPPAAPARPRVHSFCKILSASDTSIHGALTVPRRHADECLQPLDMSNQPPTQELVAKDLLGVEWRFQHVFRGQPQRHILQGAWSAFVSAKQLVAGDAFIFLRGENGELRVGFRRAMSQKANITSLVSSIQELLHIGVLAKTWHAVNNRTMFTATYKPRTSPAEFVIPCDRFMESLERNYSIGMRFKMGFEGGEAAPQTFTGIILGVSDADPAAWPDSKWRSLKVSWDKDSIPRPEWVSPWQIEPVVRPSPINLLPLSRPKRLHPNALASLPDSSNSSKEAIGEVTLEAPQNALLGALQTQEKATFVQQHGTKEDSNTALAPQSGCGHTNELHAAQKPVLRPSGFDREKSTVGTIGFQQPKDIQNPLVLCSSSEQISAAHSNFWHTVNANYQDQQGNHNMFPRSSSMMPPSTGFGLNQQNYPEMHGVGGLPQSSAQPCLIKPQPLVLAHDDAQKMNFNSKKAFWNSP